MARTQPLQKDVYTRLIAALFLVALQRTCGESVDNGKSSLHTPKSLMVWLSMGGQGLRIF
jgi:hypothetical protein